MLLGPGLRKTDSEIVNMKKKKKKKPMTSVVIIKFLLEHPSWSSFEGRVFDSHLKLGFFLSSFWSYRILVLPNIKAQH